jgi:hypothetical protein
MERATNHVGCVTGNAACEQRKGDRQEGNDKQYAFAPNCHCDESYHVQTQSVHSRIKELRASTLEKIRDLRICLNRDISNCVAISLSRRRVRNTVLFSTLKTALGAHIVSRTCGPDGNGDFRTVPSVRTDRLPVPSSLFTSTSVRLRATTGAGLDGVLRCNEIPARALTAGRFSTALVRELLSLLGPTKRSTWLCSLAPIAVPTLRAVTTKGNSFVTLRMFRTGWNHKAISFLC